MLHRGKSSDRNRKVTPPGPVAMSNEQFVEYLTSLRNHRVQRPSGARPQPPSNAREIERPLDHRRTSIDVPPRLDSTLHDTRPVPATVSSVASRTGHTVVRKSTLNEPLIKPSEVVPSARYIERGSRWMEKEEAVSIREAMEDMDLKAGDEDLRVHAAAQNEASELVWQHQNVEMTAPCNAPYTYKEHLRKNSYAHARTQSVGRYGGMGLATGLARDITPQSTAIDLGSNEAAQRGGKTVSGASTFIGQDHYANSEELPRQSLDSAHSGISAVTYDVPTMPRVRETLQRRIGGKRNVSGEKWGSFRGTQIWEEPELNDDYRGPATNQNDVPAPLNIKARNPMNRVQFLAEPPIRSNSSPSEPPKKISRFEIHRNPRSQSRSAAYTANPVTAKHTVGSSREMGSEREGLEVRSDDIRQATSMRLKDRSPKLPTPTAVSNRPSRPIVSFDVKWNPKDSDEKSQHNQQSSTRSLIQTDKPSSRPHPQPVLNAEAQAASIPTICLPDSPMAQAATDLASRSTAIDLPEFPSPTVLTPATPNCIKIIEPTSSNTPTGLLSEIDLAQVPDTPAIVPTIELSDFNQIETGRPLPNPKKSIQSNPKHQHGVPILPGTWASSIGVRATVTCHQCQLSIQGRIVALRGISERFHPDCFICFSCGTGLEELEISPEPDAKRNERIDRIRRRNAGEQIDEVEGQTMAEDGDERLRFYCHLDWHESFAPRCKHCTTPIIGEHAVALGEHWHYGHFFCAECGDPFEQGMTHIEKDGYAWCLACQTKRTERRAPKCNKCKGPVIGQYIQALGGEWHEDCFRCMCCRAGFDDGQIFPNDVDGEIVVLCTRCMERQLKA